LEPVPGGGNDAQQDEVNDANGPDAMPIDIDEL
jgi:hypothetical protein